ncbi:PREDICTED: T-cell-interacting, activating receptor on myeloid cells protein 1-like [Myotis brandtii]|uniref:T-cell-interacting, activating receptor on myeloid cells protein 1-like n=1 Tax=Myotis brandtii TaxID=109478 RepID=UPI0007040F66|nr:PREDICTED: T-cell-interacting, activating receptor on myeloid cells protein 1-like [Myotis brandtii]
MIHKLLPLLCLRLCAGQDLRRDGPLPKPSIRARPSSVFPANSHVTLRCSTPTGEVNFRHIKFTLRKNNVPLESSPSPDSPRGRAEFHLTDVKTSDAGEYTCEYYRRGSPNRRSPPSDVLLLLVTGELPKPSLHARPGRKVTAGENVILQCKKPRHMIEPHMFALLKKGTSTPIQLQSAVGIQTDFSLPSVTGSDTGAYSCVYYQPRAPFSASEPSNELRISVTAIKVPITVEEAEQQAPPPLPTGPPAAPELGGGDDEYLIQQDLLSLNSCETYIPSQPRTRH